MLEFALVFPFLLMFVVGIIDVSSMFMAESLLDEAAHRTLDRATVVINLDVNPIDADPTSYEFQRLLMARNKSNGTGVDFLSGVKVIDMSGDPAAAQGRTRLLPMRFVEDRVAGEPVTITSGIMTLIPGDCVTVLETGQVICNRESLGTTPDAPGPTQQPRLLMQKHPIKAVAVASFNGYLPFFWNKILIVEAYGYRQSIPQGPFPAWEDPQLLAEGPPLPLAEPEEPLPPPRMPEQEPFTTCVVDWGRCLQAAQNDLPLRRPFRPIDSPLTDGTCRCVLM